MVGTLKLVSLLIFGVSCFLLAPAFASSDEHPWYLAPASKWPQSNADMLMLTLGKLQLAVLFR